MTVRKTTLIYVAIVALILGAVASSVFGQGQGWDPNQARKAADKLAKTTRELYGFQVSQMTDLAKEDDRTVLLYPYLVQCGVDPVAWDQGQFGSCVGFGTARSISESYAVQVVEKSNGAWEAKFSPDAAYAFSRMISDQLGSWQGSTGAWAVEAASKWGTLLQIRYGDYDLSRYDIQRLSQWQRQGAPAELVELSKDHPCLAVHRIESTEQAKALIQSGYAILTCSRESYGQGQRDNMGFARNDNRDAWAHAMMVSGYRGQDSGRRGFLIINSWGPQFGSGPKFPSKAEAGDNAQPDGSFWVTVESMKQHIAMGDTWAIGDVAGFESRKLTLREAIDVGGRDVAQPALAP